VLPLNAYDTALSVVIDWYGRIDGLPARPYDTRSLSWSSDFTLRRNGSSEIRQPNAADGKNPHRCAAPKRDEPSSRPVSVKR